VIKSNGVLSKTVRHFGIVIDISGKETQMLRGTNQEIKRKLQRLKAGPSLLHIHFDE